jgi:hypothetical protein
MAGVTGGEYIDIPDGWGGAAFFRRLTKNGHCTYAELLRDDVFTMKDVFDMHRAQDWTDYCEMEMSGRARARAKHGRG